MRTWRSMWRWNLRVPNELPYTYWTIGLAECWRRGNLRKRRSHLLNRVPHAAGCMRSWASAAGTSHGTLPDSSGWSHFGRFRLSWFVYFPFVSLSQFSCSKMPLQQARYIRYFNTRKKSFSFIHYKLSEFERLWLGSELTWLGNKFQDLWMELVIQ
jgi:hypothetical protein